MESKIKYEANDSELVMFVREHNEEAKDALFDKYSPLLHKEIYRFKKKAQVLGIDEADLSQEAMLAFAHAVNNFSDDSDVKFITFLTLCVRRRLANFVAKFETRKRKAMLTSVPLDATIDEDNNRIVDNLEDIHTVDPLKTLINNETLDEVMKTIDEILSTNEKLALKYDLEGKTVNEIAYIMGMTTKQIYNLIHRARTKVKL